VAQRPNYPGYLLVAIVLFLSGAGALGEALAHGSSYEPPRKKPLTLHFNGQPRQSNLPLTAAERDWIAAHPVIDIAVMDAWPPLDFTGPNGEPVGVGVDILRLLAEATGLELRVRAIPFEDALAAVRGSRLDALADITPLPERQAYINFTRPYLTIPHVMVGHREGPYYAKEGQLADKELAIERGFYSVDYFRRKYPGISVREYASTAACLEAVSRGDADAYAGNRAVATYLIAQRLLTNLQVMGQIERPGSVLAIGTRKDWPELASILNKALASLDPAAKLAILRLWVGQPPDEDVEIPLTDEERAWIEANPVVRVAATPDWPPFEYLDSSGRYAGISADVLRLLAARLGLRVELTRERWPVLLEKLKQGELDLTPGAVPTDERRRFLSFTEPFFSSFIGIWANQADRTIDPDTGLAGKTIAVAQGYFVSDLVAEHFPEAKRLVVASPLEGLKAVSLDRADAFLGAEASVNYLVDRYLLQELKLLGYLEGHRMALALGVRRDAPVLHAVLEKARESLRESEIHHIQRLYIREGIEFRAEIALNDGDRHPRGRALLVGFRRPRWPAARGGRGSPPCECVAGAPPRRRRAPMRPRPSRPSPMARPKRPCRTPPWPPITYAPKVSTTSASQRRPAMSWPSLSASVTTGPNSSASSTRH